MENQDYRDLTTGFVAKKLYRFALPIIFTNLLQAIYNIVDMIIVGRFLGSAGMTAVNVGGQITMLVFVIISAFANAEAVLVGQRKGAKKEDGIEKVVYTTWIFALIVAIGLTVVIAGTSKWLLLGLNVPTEAFAQTKIYLLIYMCGTVLVYTYNVLYGMFRGIGESTVPMVFAVVSTIVNIVLDLLFVGVFSLNVGGAALATVLSQLLSVILMIVYIKKKITVFSFSKKGFHVQKQVFGDLIKVGFPQMCQFVLTNISFILIGAIINSYGVDACAAAGAANKIYNFGILPGQAVMAAVITMTAQNLPAKNYRRIYKGLVSGMILTLIIGICLFLVCQIFPAQLLGAFTTEQTVIEIGVPFMRILVGAFLVENVMFCFFGLLTGAGYTHITMLSALTSAFLVRYAFSWILSIKTGLGFNGIAVAYVLSPIMAISVSGLFTLSGKWKKPRIRA